MRLRPFRLSNVFGDSLNRAERRGESRFSEILTTGLSGIADESEDNSRRDMSRG